MRFIKTILAGAFIGIFIGMWIGFNLGADAPILSVPQLDATEAAS